MGLMLMIVPTFCMGASFPLATRLYVDRLERVAKGVGVLYAANTVGAIFGSFAASFLLIPAVGVRNAVFSLAVLNLTAAALAASGRTEGWRWRRAVPWAAIGALAMGLAAVLVPATVFDPIYASAEQGKALIHVDETATGTVTVHETPSGFRVISVNGLNVAGTKFGFHCTQKLQAHFPLLMHPDPRNIMQIGFGTGGTCWSVTLHESVERVDCVEINPGIIKAAPFFEGNNHGVYVPGVEPRVHLNIEDARNFVATTATKYDIILSDSIHPRFTGNGLLYTKDYYELCARALTENGIVSTWMPTAFLGVDEFKAIVRSMRASFPHILIWYMNNTVEGYAILMGSRTPFQADFDALARRMAVPGLKEDLDFVHLEDVYDLLDCIALSGPDIDGYLAGGTEMNTEDKPIIEFRSPRRMNRIVTEYQNLADMIDHRTFPEAVLAGGWGADPAAASERHRTLQGYFDGTTGVLLAHQAHLVGQFAKEEALLRRVLQINPDDRDAPFLLERLNEIKRGGQDPEW
jgi:spermidine synthase